MPPCQRDAGWGRGCAGICVLTVSHPAQGRAALFRGVPLPFIQGGWESRVTSRLHGHALPLSEETIGQSEASAVAGTTGSLLITHIHTTGASGTVQVAPAGQCSRGPWEQSFGVALDARSARVQKGFSYVSACAALWAALLAWH